MRPAAHLPLAAFLLIAGACNIDNEGETPPRGTLYFPNALALVGEGPDGPPSRLLVTNSNFDLRYKAGTLQAYDLEKLADEVARCEDDADAAIDEGRRPEDCILQPLGDEETGQQRVLVDEVLVGSFTNGLAISPEGDHAFVASRTKPSLTIVDLDVCAGDDLFQCGSAVSGCTTQAARGTDPETGKRREAWPGDPTAVLARPMTDWVVGGEDLGNYVLVAHATGDVSLYTERLGDDGLPSGEYELRHVLENLPRQFNAMRYDAATGLVYLSWAPVPPLFSNSGKRIVRIGVSVPELDGSPDTTQASAYTIGSVLLEGVASLTDTRDLAFIEHGTPEPENRALIVARDPNALLLADVDETRNPAGIGYVLRTATLGSGPSRLVVGELEGEIGTLRVAVVACFNGREIFVIDLETMNVRTVIPNLSGPFDLALDEPRRLLYVTDFRSSVIRIIDLSPLTDPTAPEGARVVATLGKARVVQELQ